jgi:cytochrome d ubiquinol oxidase subunit I
MSVSAFYYLKNKYQHFAVRSFTIAIVIGGIASIMQLVVGHRHGEVVAEYQPAKLAGYEGLYKTTGNAPLYILGYSDPEKKKTVGIKIPGMLSYLIHGDYQAEVKGLAEFPESDWPPVGMIFQTYHLMVALGMFFIGLTLFSFIYLWKGNFFRQKWLLKIFVISVILPVISNQLGWASAEMGRQPWIVQNLLRTGEGISKSVTSDEIILSVILFILVYILLFLVWIYILDREIKHGPDCPEDMPAAGFNLKSLKLAFLNKKNK